MSRPAASRPPFPHPPATDPRAPAGFGPRGDADPPAGPCSSPRAPSGIPAAAARGPVASTEAWSGPELPEHRLARRWSRRADRWAAALTDALAAGAELLVPQTCASCGQHGAAVCPVCRAMVHRFTARPFDAGPGAPQWPEGRVCLAAGVYRHEVARLVLAFKNAQRTDAVSVLASALGRALRHGLEPGGVPPRRTEAPSGPASTEAPGRLDAAEGPGSLASADGAGCLAGAELIVPVPSSAAAFRRRGFVPAQVLARAALRRLGLAPRGRGRLDVGWRGGGRRDGPAPRGAERAARPEVAAVLQRPTPWREHAVLRWVLGIVDLVVGAEGMFGTGEGAGGPANRSGQKGLGRSQRARRMHGSMRVQAPPLWRVLGVHPHVRGRRCVLVDDVLTTGATLREAARALEAEGAVVLGAVVLASVRAPVPGGSSRSEPAESAPHQV